MNSPTICLVMICKSEAGVILRALESARPVIDSWVIVDTGSTDGTQDLICDSMEDIPGKLYERPWVDFGTNRTEALELARGTAEYFLILDADDILEMAKPAELSEAAYMLEICYGDLRYYRTQLVRADLDWKYVGVLHEYIHDSESHELNAVLLPNARIHITREGNRAKDPERYWKDAEVLERALIGDPTNDRYMFYLAQSYRDSKQIQNAIQAYQRRAGMGGWAEEVWYSLYQVGELCARQSNFSEALTAYLAAFENRPTRAEPLYKLGKLYSGLQQWNLAEMFLSRAAAIPYPANDRLFIERSIYDHLIQIELAVCLHYLDQPERSAEINQELLDSGRLPAHLVPLVEQNQAFDLARRTAAA